MAIEKKMPKNIAKAIEDLTGGDRGKIMLGNLVDIAEGLEAWIAEQEDERNAKSETWRQAGQGEAHRQFIDQAQAIYDGLVAVIDAFDQIDFSLPTYEVG